MKNNRSLLIITVLVALMLACNISIGGVPASASPTPVVIVVTQLVTSDTAIPPTDEAITSTPEPQPSETAAIVATATASAPMVTPLKDPVNCRFGPSIFWEQVFALEVGAYMPVVGKSADGGWWLVTIPDTDNKTCWVGKSVTTVTGDVSAIATAPVVDAFISDVSLQIRPNSVNAGVDCLKKPSTPFTLTGNVSTNGPLEIRWHIETEQDGRQEEKTLKFDRFGPHPISFTYVPGTWKKGDFWIRLVITQPKGMVADVTYQVKCQ